MNPFRLFFRFFILLSFLLIGQTSFAQQSKNDSLAISRQKSIDSTKKAQKQRTDSLAAIRKYKESKKYKDSVTKARTDALNELRETRQRYTDSVSAARKAAIDSAIEIRKKNTEILRQRQKARTDSLAKIRKYKESKKYKDSVTKSRTARLDSIRNSRTRYFDSLKSIRQKTLDSAISSRKRITDSLKAKQKIRTDSLTRIRKYKESRRYRDSVQVTRQSRLDSIRTMRKIYSDNIISARKKNLDSLTKLRKQKLDSLTKVRKIKADSLKNLRDLRADSLAKKKELREKQIKADQKKKEEKMKMQFELKMKKKHEAWSNEKMLKKKWTWVRQGFQNTFTRYNYHYNARRKMIEANGNMRRRKKDNFEQLIDLFPFDPNKDSTVFASDMDTIIRKASVGLQIHDPRTKWADDLYLLMGEAYYFKGDYERADASFKYIIGMNKALKLKKKKKDDNDQLIKKERSRLSKLFKHQPAHNDAILWLTRTYADSKKEGEAEAILDLIDASTKLSDNMKAKIALEKANLHVRKGEYSDAGKQLSSILKSKAISKYTRQRASFLNGQLYYRLGQYDSAEISFKKNLALHPPIEMDFYAQKYRADAVAQGGGDQSKSIASLKKMLRDGKYAPYHEQVYYLLGKLSANDNRTDEAIAYYAKSLQQTKTTPKQKAITFAAMGNLQYRTGQYNLAKKSYDSASYFAKGIKDNAELDLAIKRGKSLDKIEEPFYTLRDQDSLLKLAAMNEKEQRAVVKKYLKYLEKQKEDSVLNADAASKSGSLAGSVGTSGGTNNWYFSSTVAVQQGFNDFKRKWGNRPLADNWRRASASTFGADALIGVDNSGDEDGDENGITEANLMAAIPKTELQLSSANKKLKRAYINLGQAYIKDLEEYKEGLAILDTLDKRFPNHEYPDEVLSIRYTAALRQGKLEDAEDIRQRLLSTYPNSNFSLALRTEESSDITASKNTVSENVGTYYETTYQLTNERKYEEVIQRVAVAKRIYGDVNYSRKFRILEAESYAAIGNYKKADTLLSGYVKEYPSDSLRPWVDAINNYINVLKASDTLGTDSTGKSGSAVAKDSTSAKVDSGSLAKTVPTQYVYAPKETHYCIFIFGKPDGKTAGFKVGLLDYSKLKFSGITLTTEIEMLNAEQSIVIAKPFGSASQAKIFMNSAKNEKLLFREMEARSYQYYIISEQNYLKLKSDKKMTDYVNFYQKNYK